MVRLLTRIGHALAAEHGWTKDAMTPSRPRP